MRNKLITFISAQLHSFRGQLLILFIVIGLVPIAGLSWYVYTKVVDNIVQMQGDILNDASSLNLDGLRGKFAEAEHDIEYWASIKSRRELLNDINNEWKKSNQPLELFVRSDTFKMIEKNHKDPRLLADLKVHDPFVYDLKLIDKDGNIIFSLVQEKDFGTNLLQGPFQSTLFGQMVRKTLLDGKGYFSDLERYAPSKNVVTGFITEPMRDETGAIVGVMVMQLDMSIMLESFIHTKSEKILNYLVGQDGLLRTYIDTQEEVLSRSIHHEAFLSWKREHLESKNYQEDMIEKAIFYVDANNLRVLGQHQSFHFRGVTWAHISEMRENRVMAVPYSLLTAIFLFVTLGGVVIVYLASLFSKYITNPILLLSKASIDYIEGDKTVQVKLNAGNELDAFSQVFNQMITTQNENEKHLKKLLNDLKEQKYALDFHSIVGITDIKGNITFVNKKFEEISGYTKEELIGQNHRMLNSESQPSSYWKAMYDTVSHGNIWHDTVQNKAKDGHYYWVDTTIVPFMDDNNKPRSYIAIRFDLTERMKMEKELHIAKEVAEDSVRSKSEFLAAMSHEIRTPMNGVLGMLGLLEQSQLDNTQRHRVHVAQSSATSLLGLINDILDFSKIEAGKMDLENIEFNLRDELGEFAEAIAFKAQEKGLELILDTTQVHVQNIIADPGRLRQIMTNIVGNAVKFTHQGHILIRASIEVIDEEHGRLFIDITDSGIGIPPQKINTLFEAFTQADGSTTRKYGGTGLGLSIVKRLCELMNGTVGATSIPNEGSTFSVEVDIGLGTNNELVIPAVSVEGKTVLIIDDNEINRAVVRAQLEQWGMITYEAEDAMTAFDKCQVQISKGCIPPYDVALVDMQMPDMDGAQLGKEIRKINGCDDMKMVMMTSLGSRHDAKIFADLGFNAFFAKPTTAKDLLDALKVLFDDGEALHSADPLLTKDYLGRLKNEQSEILWPANTRILLVEDNTTNQLVAQGMLESIGLRADIAADGLEALESLQLAQEESVPYSFVLMDCQMPEMDGYTASTAIRAGKAGEANTKIPIIAMTANAMSGDREKCILSGMDDYISKPINLSILKATIIKWLFHDGSVPMQAATTAGETEATVPLLEFPLWDEADALHRLGDNSALLNKIIQSFMNDGKKSLASLREALDEGSCENAQLHAHSLKGSAGNVGALKLQNISKHLEEAAKNQHLEEVRAGYDECENVLNETLALFEIHLVKEIKPTVKKKRLDPLQMAIKLQGLKKEIESGIFIDTDATGIFVEYTDEVFTQNMGTLKDHINSFEMEKTTQLIEQIMAELE